MTDRNCQNASVPQHCSSSCHSWCSHDRIVRFPQHLIALLRYATVSPPVGRMVARLTALPRPPFRPGAGAPIGLLPAAPVLCAQRVDQRLWPPQRRTCDGTRNQRLRHARPHAREQHRRGAEAGRAPEARRQGRVHRWPHRRAPRGQRQAAGLGKHGRVLEEGAQGHCCRRRAPPQTT